MVEVCLKYNMEAGGASIRVRKEEKTVLKKSGDAFIAEMGNIYGVMENSMLYYYIDFVHSAAPLSEEFRTGERLSPPFTYAAVLSSVFAGARQSLRTGENQGPVSGTPQRFAFRT